MNFTILILLSLVALVVGLINPKIVIKWGDKKTRGKVLLYYGLGAILFFVLFGISSDATKESETVVKEEKEEQYSEDTSQIVIKTEQQKPKKIKLKFNEQRAFNKTTKVPANKIWIAPIGFPCDAITNPDCLKGLPLIGDRWNGYIMKNGKKCKVTTWTENVVDKFDGLSIENEKLLDKQNLGFITIDWYFILLPGTEIGTTSDARTINVFEFEVVEH